MNNVERSGTKKVSRIIIISFYFGKYAKLPKLQFIRSDKFYMMEGGG